MEKADKSWQDFEAEVAKFFDITFGSNGAGKRDVAGYEIDCVAIVQGFIFIVECKYSKPSSESISIKKNYRTEILEFIGKKTKIYNYLNKQPQQLKPIWIFCTKGNPPVSENYEIAKEHDVAVWTNEYLKTLKKLKASLKEQLLWQVVYELGYDHETINHGSSEYFRYPALPRKAAFNSSEVDVYNFFIPAKDLIPMSYVFRINHTEADSYQRLLDLSKVKKIGAFIDNGNTINTSLLINLSRGTRFFEQPGSENHENIYGFISIPKVRNSVRIIDGQHRLYGFLHATSEKEREQMLPVMALVGASGAQEAQAFIDINKNQKAVAKNDLLVILAKTDPNGAGLIPNIILSMNRMGPFKGRIKVAGERISGKFKLTLTTMNGVITSNNIVVQDSKAKTSVVNVNDYDSMVVAKKDAKRYIELLFLEICSVAKQVSPKWEGGFIYTNPGFQIIMPLLREAKKYADGESLERVISEVAPHTKSFFEKNVHSIADLRTASSAASRANYSYELLMAVNEALPGFAQRVISNFTPLDYQRNVEYKGDNNIEQAIVLEKEIKEFTDAILTKSQYGSAWFESDQIVEKRHRDYAVQEREKEKASYFDIEDDEPSLESPIFYLPLGLVKDIIKRNKPMFRGVVEAGFDQFIADIDTVAAIGNKRHEGMAAKISIGRALAFQQSKERLEKLIRKYKG